MIYGLLLHHFSEAAVSTEDVTVSPIASCMLLPEFSMPSDLPGLCCSALPYPTAVRIRQQQFTLSAAYCSPFYLKTLSNAIWRKSFAFNREALQGANQLWWANETCLHKTSEVLLSLIFYNHAALRCNKTEKYLRFRLISIVHKEIEKKFLA